MEDNVHDFDLNMRLFFNAYLESDNDSMIELSSLLHEQLQEMTKMMGAFDRGRVF